MKLSQLDILVLGALMSKGKEDATAVKLLSRASKLSAEKFGQLSAVTGLILMELTELLEQQGRHSEIEPLAEQIRAIFAENHRLMSAADSDGSASGENPEK